MRIILITIIILSSDSDNGDSTLYSLILFIVSTYEEMLIVI